MLAAADIGWRPTALALAWLAGVAAHLQLRSLPSALACGAGIAIALLGLAFAWRRRRAFVAALLGMALLAFSASGLRAASRLADALPVALEGHDLTVTGVIAGLPQRGASGWRFRFDVESARLLGEPVRVPERLAVGWYDARDAETPANPLRSELRAGQRWRFALRLRQPHGNLNPHGFDHELHLFEQGVRGTGYVRDAPAPELLHREGGHPVERLRQRVRDAIEATVADRRSAGVLAALAVGDQGAIEREDWDLYRNTGIAHLVSISGLHITMFAWLAGRGVGALWRRSGAAMLRLPVPFAARWGGLACAAAYAVFSGWGVPAQRTVWMLAVVTVAQSLGLRWPWLLVLLLAAVVVTAFDPWALLQAGFWLSFVAVGVLMASAAVPQRSGTGTLQPCGTSVWRRGSRQLWGVLRGGVRTQAIATIALTPLTLVFFQQVSLVGFAANLVAIPLVTLVITPLALLGSAVPVLWIAGASVVQGLNAVLGALAALPGSVWQVPAAPWWAQIAGLAGAVLLVLPLPWRVRALALPLIVPLLLPARDLPAEGDFELLALDVGQGSAVLVRTRAHLLVFDAGPRYSPDSDAGQRVLLPLLRARGEARVDTLLLSHRDTDHVGGAQAVLAALPVGDLLSSLERDHPLLAVAGHTTRCSAGQSWQWDGVRFDLLRPHEADYTRTLKPNAMSCVLRVSAGGRSALLTGDIERAQEVALLADHGDALRSDVLLVPHHGSRTSSTPAFLDAVRPRVAVFQAGYRNRFGHPAPDVMQRYRERGIEIRASPDCGAWRWSARADVEVGAGRCERDAARRYWHRGRE